MTPEVRARLDEIERLIHAACAEAFKAPDRDRATVEAEVGRALVARAQGHHLDYHTEWSADAVLRLVPHDLFTGLILAGVPFTEAVGAFRERAHLGAGGHTRFATATGTYEFGPRGLTFRPCEPAEIITLDFKTLDALVDY